MPPGMQAGMRISLLCQWAGGGSTDPDAQAFIDAAQISDAGQIAAINQLVQDLKAYPASGTPYWERLLVAYPFVGGNAAAHSYNLVDPTLHQITWHTRGSGTPITHSANGAKGSSLDTINGGYGDTHFTIPPARLNDLCVLIYKQQIATSGNNRFILGARDTAQTVAKEDIGGPPLAFDVNCAPTAPSFPAHAQDLGPHLFQRVNDGTSPPPNSLNTAVWDSVAWAANSNTVSTTTPAFDIHLFAFNISGTATFFTDMQLSSVALLTKLTDSEMVEFKGIWDTFNTALGRGHPLGV